MNFETIIGLNCVELKTDSKYLLIWHVSVQTRYKYKRDRLGDIRIAPVSRNKRALVEFKGW